MHLNHIILGLCMKIFQINSFTRKNCAMHCGMRKLHDLKVRCYSAHTVETNNYLYIFSRVKGKWKNRETESNKIPLHSIPNGWIRQAYVQGLDFEDVNFKQAIDGGGSGTLVSGLTGIPLFYYWVTYHYWVCLIFLWRHSNLSWRLETNPPPRAVSWSLLDSWCLVFGISDDEKGMQWFRGIYQICVQTTTFQHESKHQMATHT